MQKKKTWRDVVRMATLGAAVVGASAMGAVGCLDRPLEPVEPKTTTTIIERLTQSAVDKIDILLVIDNSRSMADKQEILSLAVPDLVRQLVNPECVDDDGMIVGPKPATPLDECPAGSEREFDPIVDIHVGVITSSLGGKGADSCSSNPTEDDRGRLITRSGAGGDVQTYQGLGFLVWDPDSSDPTHMPQGETNIDNLEAQVQDLVGGAGENGCGYEAVLESWYRFLVEPAPYDSVSVVNGEAVPEGIDNNLLQQRRDFLRPDSLLAIIMLADENDCSIRDGGQFYFAAQIYQPGIQRTRTICRFRRVRLAPPTRTSECCRSCGQGAGRRLRHVSQDMCEADNAGRPLSELDDHINLRCYDQKQTLRYRLPVADRPLPPRRFRRRRSPIETATWCRTRSSSISIPDDDNNAVRDPGLVFIAGIVGVPWQDIARKDANGMPDLLDRSRTWKVEPVGGFQSGAELAAQRHLRPDPGRSDLLSRRGRLPPHRPADGSSPSRAALAVRTR